MIARYDPIYWSTIASWWCARNEEAPHEQFMPETTFTALDQAGLPCGVISVCFGSNPYWAFVDNFCVDPLLDKKEREAIVVELFSFIEKLAKDQGFKRLIGFTKYDKLVSRYEKVLGCSVESVRPYVMTKLL